MDRAESVVADRDKLALPPTLILPPLLPPSMSLPTLRFAHPLFPSLPLRSFNTHRTQERSHRNLFLLTLGCARPFGCAGLLEAPDTPLANHFTILRVVREQITPDRLARIVVLLLALRLRNHYSRYIA